jgi:hypothetical protein
MIADTSVLIQLFPRRNRKVAIKRIKKIFTSSEDARRVYREMYILRWVCLGIVIIIHRNSFHATLA